MDDLIAIIVRALLSFLGAGKPAIPYKFAAKAPTVNAPGKKDNNVQYYWDPKTQKAMRRAVTGPAKKRAAIPVPAKVQAKPVVAPPVNVKAPVVAAPAGIQRPRTAAPPAVSGEALRDMMHTRPQTLKTMIVISEIMQRPLGLRE